MFWSFQNIVETLVFRHGGRWDSNPCHTTPLEKFFSAYDTKVRGLLASHVSRHRVCLFWYLAIWLVDEVWNAPLPFSLPIQLYYLWCLLGFLWPLTDSSPLIGRLPNHVVPPAHIMEEYLKKSTAFVEAVCVYFVAWNWESWDWDGLFWIF